MDNLLNLDNMDMIKILGFLHDDIKQITHNIVQYTEDGMTYITDLNDRVIVKCKKDNIKVLGTFVAYSTDTLVNNWGWGEKRIVNVLNLLTNKSKVFSIYSLREIRLVADEFIIVDKSVGSSKNVLYNKFFEELYIFGYLAFTRVTSENTIKAILTYRDLEVANSFKTMVLNKQSASVELYDSVSIDEKDGLVALGKEWKHRSERFVVGSFLPSIEYVLCNNGKTVGKCYHAIEKTTELSQTNYLLVYSITDAYNEVFSCRQGIIDTNGNEWIPPVYDKVSYIGSNTFLLYFNNFVNIYTIGKGELFRNIPEGNIWIHQTLPMVIVKNINKYVAIDVFGRQFDVNDISKYFEVYTCKDHEDTFRINTGYKVVYTYRNLIPITNIHQISILNTCKWEKN